METKFRNPKAMKKLIIPVLVFLLLSLACSKDHHDYRIKYTGNYNFTLIDLFFGDTTSYTGTIELGDEVNVIVINVGPHPQISRILYEDGTFGPSSSDVWYFGGEFETVNSMDVYDSYIEGSEGSTYVHKFHIFGERMK
jgi:hypothetical protein